MNVALNLKGQIEESLQQEPAEDLEAYEQLGVYPIEEGFQTYHEISQASKLLGLTVSGMKKHLLDFESQGFKISRRKTGAIDRRVFYTKDIFEFVSRWKKKERLNRRKARKAPVVVSFYTSKGGVGKTSMAREFSCATQLLGLKTLIIDLDLQFNLTTIFGYEPEISLELAAEYNFPTDQVIQHSVGALMGLERVAKASFPEVVKKPYGEFGVHLIPGNDDLREVLEGVQQKLDPIKVFRNLIRKAVVSPTPELDFSDYDVIVFDCGAEESAITRAAFASADFCICPVNMCGLSLKGISHVVRLAQRLEDETQGDSPIPELIAIGNRYRKNLRVDRNLKQLSEHYGEIFVGPPIKEYNLMPDSQESGRKVPTFFCSPGHEMSKDILELTKNIWAHIDNNLAGR